MTHLFSTCVFHPRSFCLRSFFWGWLFVCSGVLSAYANEPPTIDVWYGDEQSFGQNGSPQRWVNVLGKVTGPAAIESLSYTLNGGEAQSLSLGPDFRRLARPGDFNVEIDSGELREGKNTVEILAKGTLGGVARRTVTLQWHPGRKCSLPFEIDWSKHEKIQDAVQVVDGLWKLTPEGARTVEPYYDRVLGFGDASWRNYEMTTRIKFHGIRRPGKRDGGHNVIHAALAVRWPGHDLDNKQPHVKWFPLGATCEFTLQAYPKPCRWRILGGAGKSKKTKETYSIEWEKWYVMKLRVQSPQPETTRYWVKIWDADGAEPEAWAVETEEGADEVPAGGALILAHYSDVTFGKVSVVAVEGAGPPGAAEALGTTEEVNP